MRIRTLSSRARHCEGASCYAVQMETLGDLPILLFATPQEWESWLESHHTEQSGIWLKIARKDGGGSSVTYSDALDVALCFGWIDGQKKPSDQGYWLQKFTPRRAKSIWSQVNTERVARLQESGRMREQGLREVEAARAEGRWDAAYASQRNFVLPADFLEALKTSPSATAFFETLNRANRYAIFFRIEAAKKPQTRKARIDTFIAMLERQEKLHS